MPTGVINFIKLLIWTNTLKVLPPPKTIINFIIFEFNLFFDFYHVFYLNLYVYLFHIIFLFFFFLCILPHAKTSKQTVAFFKKTLPRLLWSVLVVEEVEYSSQTVWFRLFYVIITSFLQQTQKMMHKSNNIEAQKLCQRRIRWRISLRYSSAIANKALIYSCWWIHQYLFEISKENIKTSLKITDPSNLFLCSLWWV